MKFVEIDVEKLYPKHIRSIGKFASCCVESMKEGDEIYCDPYSGLYHTYDCINKEIGFIKIHFHPERKHDSGLTFGERIEELMKSLDTPVKFIKIGWEIKDIGVE